MKIVETASDYARKINNINIHFLGLGVWDACNNHHYEVVHFNVECDGSNYGPCCVLIFYTKYLGYIDFGEIVYADAKWKDCKKRDEDFMHALYSAIEEEVKVFLPIWKEYYENKWLIKHLELSGLRQLSIRLGVDCSKLRLRLERDCTNFQWKK